MGALIGHPNRDIFATFRKWSGSESIAARIWASDRGVSHFKTHRGDAPANIAISDISLKTRFFGLYFRRRKYIDQPLTTFT